MKPIESAYLKCKFHAFALRETQKKLEKQQEDTCYAEREVEEPSKAKVAKRQLESNIGVMKASARKERLWDAIVGGGNEESKKKLRGNESETLSPLKKHH